MKEDTETITTDCVADPPASLQTPKQFKPLTLDLSLYDECLRDPALPDEVRQEMLKAIWTIIGCFIDLKIPVELEDVPAEENCGELDARDCPRAGETPDLVESKPDYLTELEQEPASNAREAEQEEA